MEKIIIQLKRVELIGLYMLFFFLPFLKVPKNIGLFLFILGALSWRLLDKNIRWRKPDTFELLLILFVLISAISTLLNWPFPKGISGFKDSLTITAIGLIVYNFRFQSSQITNLVNLFLFGAVIGLGYGYYEYHMGISKYFEYKNMSVAETATITAIALAISISVILDSTATIELKKKMIYGALSILFFSCLVAMGNRSGLLGFSLFFLYLLLFGKKNYKLYLSAVILVGLTATVIFLSNEKFSSRISHIFSTEISMESGFKFNSNDTHRFNHWELAVAQFKLEDNKLFGIGPRNFPSIDIAALNEKSEDLNLKKFTHLHAHNMYLNKLVEEGIFGLAILAILLGYSLLKIWQSQILRNDWITTTGLAAIIIPMIAGIFYAPYIREVAWVSFLFIALAANKNNNQTLNQRLN